MLLWPGVRTWLEERDIRLGQEGVRSGAVVDQWAEGVRDAARSVSDQGEQVGGRECTVRSHHSNVCTGCPEPRKFWRQEEEQERARRGRGVLAWVGGWDSLRGPQTACSTLIHPHPGLSPVQISQVPHLPEDSTCSSVPLGIVTRTRLPVPTTALHRQQRLCACCAIAWDCVECECAF